ncbi:MAG TPA: hypothetical protein PKD90_09790 [Phnomibacter sp.]|nr:hypothetical protein [Phnomibacter sp.]
MEASKAETPVPVVLPPLLLADMYGSNLVVIGTEATATPTLPAQLTPALQQPAATTHPEVTTAMGTVTNAEGEGLPTTAPKALAWLGGFGRQVIIMVHEPDAVHCSDEHLAFLTNILKAVQLSMQDVAIVNLAHHPANYERIWQQLPPRTALFFGVEPHQIGVPMRFPPFQVQAWGSTVYVHAPALRLLNGSSPGQVEQKKLLWQALKRIFAV